MSDVHEHGIARGLTNYGDRAFALYLRRSFIKSMGYSTALLERPIVGIASSGSGFNNCHRAMPELVEAVKRGVLAAGGLPIEFPTISLGEVFLNPTSLMFRNLMSMDVEEMVRAQPMDSVVLVGGCDKTVPAQLMGAAAADVPAIQLVTGPMMTGRHEGERLGACTDCRRFWGSFRAGKIDRRTIDVVEGRLATTAGTCAVMGTASTMACIAEALGMSLPGTAAIPAVHADRLRAAEASGAAAVQLIHAPIRPSQVITPRSVENALRVLLALGGSTNAIIHLTAIAGRLNIPVSLRRLNELSDETPVLVNLKPTGEHYMEDFYAAGGMSALLRELRPLLHLDTLTVTGESLGQRLAAEADAWVDHRVIRPAHDPIEAVGGLVALFGSLAPGRGDPQAIGRGQEPVREGGSRGRLQLAGGPERTRRRPRPGHPGGRHHGAAERRPDQRVRHAGGRLPADPPQAGAAGRAGHGSHLGCAHERDRLRHHRAARDARVGCGRTPGPGAQRRPHPPVGTAAPGGLAGRRR